jgi:hypothetical protein
MGSGEAKVNETVWSRRSWFMATISTLSPSAVVYSTVLISSSC